MRLTLGLLGTLLLTLCAAIPAHAALRDDVGPQEPASESSLAVIDWADASPGVAPVGDDRYLLWTKTGVQLWDVRRNVFSPVSDWPGGYDLRIGGTRVGNTTVLVAQRRGDADPLQHLLMLWNAKEGRLTHEFALPPGQLVDKVVALDARRFLLCKRVGFTWLGPLARNYRSLPTEAQVWSLEEHDFTLDPSPALLGSPVRGDVSGLSVPAMGNEDPVQFDTRTCSWDMKNPPAELAGVKNLEIRPHRLPDGRFLVTHAKWENQWGHQVNARNPWLWEHGAGEWRALHRTAKGGGSPDLFWSFGSGDAIVAMKDIEAHFVEFLDTDTLTWSRSAQSLGHDDRALALAPLSDGRALLFLQGGARVIAASPLRELLPQRLAYWHSEPMQTVLADHRLLLIGADAANRPEMVSLRGTVPQSVVLAPVPADISYPSAVELGDGTVLAFGALPGQCTRLDDRPGLCGQPPAQHSYRYFPSKDRWQLVPGLEIGFELGWVGPWIGKHMPRLNVSALSKQRLAFLQNRSADCHTSTVLYTWSAREGTRAVAKLRGERSAASLVRLKDGRLAAIGGFRRDFRGLDDAYCDKESIAGHAKHIRNTEVFAEAATRWRAGPRAHFAGGRAYILRSGRIFKLSGWEAGGYRYAGEVADARFRRWAKLPPLPIKYKKEILDISVVGDRVFLLPEDRADPTVVWDDTRRRWIVPTDWQRDGLSVLPGPPGHVVLRTFNRLEVLPVPR